MKYLISLRTPKTTFRKVWNDSSTLGLGHPFAYFLEKTALGVQIRSLNSTIAQNSKHCLEISASELFNGVSIVLERIRSTLQLLPMPHETGLLSSGHLLAAPEEETSARTFKRSSLIAFVGLALLIMI